MNSFWKSRTRSKLAEKAEKRGQDILGVFARGKLAGQGTAIREAVCGIGFVDILIKFSSGLLHIVELKMLKGVYIPGAAQLARYMVHMNRNVGWLVFFDARNERQKSPVPAVIKTKAGIIRTVVIDINPIPPHKMK